MPVDDLRALLARAREAAAPLRGRVWVVSGDEAETCTLLDERGAAAWLEEWADASA